MLAQEWLKNARSVMDTIEQTQMDAIKKAKPSAAKGSYIRKVTVTTSMGPGIRVDVLQAQSMSTKE